MRIARPPIALRNDQKTTKNDKKRPGSAENFENFAKSSENAHGSAVDFGNLAKSSETAHTHGRREMDSSGLDDAVCSVSAEEVLLSSGTLPYAVAFPCSPSLPESSVCTGTRPTLQTLPDTSAPERTESERMLYMLVARLTLQNGRFPKAPEVLRAADAHLLQGTGIRRLQERLRMMKRAGGIRPCVARAWLESSGAVSAPPDVMRTSRVTHEVAQLSEECNGELPLLCQATNEERPLLSVQRNGELPQSRHGYDEGGCRHALQPLRLTWIPLPRDLREQLCQVALCHGWLRRGEQPIHTGVLKPPAGVHITASPCQYTRILLAPSSDLRGRVVEGVLGVLEMLLEHKKVLSPCAHEGSCTFVTACLLIDSDGRELVMDGFGEGLLPRPEDCGVCTPEHMLRWNPVESERPLMLESGTCHAALVSALCKEWSEHEDGGSVGALWCVLRLFVLAQMGYTHRAIWDRVWGGGAFVGCIHANKWRCEAASRTGMAPERYMYGDCISLSVTTPTRSGVLVNAAQLDEWLNEKAVASLVRSGHVVRSTAASGKRMGCVCCVCGMGCGASESWTVWDSCGRRHHVCTRHLAALLRTIADAIDVARDWVWDRKALMSACSQAWRGIMCATNPHTLLVCDADGQDWVHSKYARIVDAEWNATHPCPPTQSMSCLMRYPSVSLKVLTTESSNRGNYGDARAMLCLHALCVKGMVRPLLASHKFVTGGEGHLARPGKSGVDWHEGTTESVRDVCARCMRSMGYAWGGVEYWQGVIEPTVSLASMVRMRKRYLGVCARAPPTLLVSTCASQLLDSPEDGARGLQPKRTTQPEAAPRRRSMSVSEHVSGSGMGTRSERLTSMLRVTRSGNGSRRDAKRPKVLG